MPTPQRTQRQQQCLSAVALPLKICWNEKLIFNWMSFASARSFCETKLPFLAVLVSFSPFLVYFFLFWKIHQSAGFRVNIHPGPAVLITFAKRWQNSIRLTDFMSFSNGALCQTQKPHRFTNVIKIFHGNAWQLFCRNDFCQAIYVFHLCGLKCW